MMLLITRIFSSLSILTLSHSFCSSSFGKNMFSFSRLSLKSSSIAATTITNGVIIGGGRIGNLLWELNDKKDILLKSRDDPIPDITGPIYICTRNNDLEAIIQKTSESRKNDLVFLQNGILLPYLNSKNLGECTQGLIYFAVSKKGESPIDGKTDVNPEGLTAVTGKWSDDFASRLQKGGLACKVLNKDDWYIAMLEKHIWICAFMAVGVKYGCTVGQVEATNTDEVSTLIREMATAAEKETGVRFPNGLESRLCAYARSVSHFPTALKEVEWRNGWFLDISFRSELLEGIADPLPLHTSLIKGAGSNIYENALASWRSTQKS